MRLHARRTVQFRHQHCCFRQLHPAHDSINPFASAESACDRTEFCIGMKSTECLRDLKRDLKTGAAARLSIVATDVDDAVLARARKGCYPGASLRELPPDLLARGFEEADQFFCILERHRRDITFMHHDLRSEAIPGFFDLILCRNLAFTYFAPRLQCQVLERLAGRLRPNGWLVIGAHERLPGAAAHRLTPLAAAPYILMLGNGAP